MQPPRLYHYTNQSGVLGILESQKLWASDIRYLNDSSEMHHGLAAAEEAVDALFGNHGTPGLEAFHGALRRNLKMARITADVSPLYVLSFSEQADLLSQWRAYGGASGFALGFEITVDDTVARAPDVRLRDCRYVPGALQEGLREFVEPLLEAAEAADSELRRRLVANLGAAVVGLAPIHKHPAFAEEREWRLIMEEGFVNQAGLTPWLRPGRLLPIPYVPVPFKGTGVVFQLREIVVGPTSEPQLARGAVEDFIAWSGLYEDVAVSVRNSVVPWRLI